MEPNEKKTYMIIALSVAAILLFVFIIRPAMTGYSIYDQIKDTNYSLETYAESITDLQTRIASKDTNLSICYDFNERIENEINNLRVENVKLTSEVNDIKKEYDMLKQKYLDEIEDASDELRQEIINFNKEIDDYDSKYTDLEEGYDALAKNAANNICCKKKVDNKNIKYYDIENNKIVCLEEGHNEIECN